MLFFYVVTSIFQFMVLLAATGVLTAVVMLARLMELAINIVQPMTIFMLRQSGNLVIVILTDLSSRFPCLQNVLRPEYVPYVNTAGTVLLGWLIISWLSHLVWAVLIPLAVAVIAIVLISPMTANWCLEQTIPRLEVAFVEIAKKLQTVLAHVRT